MRCRSRHPSGSRQNTGLGRAAGALAGVLLALATGCRQRDLDTVDSRSCRGSGVCGVLPEGGAPPGGAGAVAGTRNDRAGAPGSAGAPGDGGAAGSPGDSGGGGAGSEPPAFSEVTCRSLGEGPECVVEGAGDELVVRADVLTPTRSYRGGEVRVRADGTIACAGCDCPSETPARRVTCAGAVVAPAFVNPHDHVAYAHQPPPPARTERSEHRHDWRLGVRGHTAIDYEGGATPAARAAHELRMLMDGVTAIAGGAGHVGLVRNLDMPGLEEGVRVAPANSDTFPLDDADGLFVRSGCAYGAGHTRADETLRTGAYLPHLGEGIDAEAKNELVCALDFSLVGATTGVVHAVAADALLARALGARRALVVWSPRSNLSLYGNTAPVTLLRRSGVEVALGTDWLLSGSMNVRRELECARSYSAQYLDGELDAAALLRMATASAARAAGAGAALGRIAPGTFADLQIVRRRGLEPHAAVIGAAPADVLLVFRAGVPLYGDAAVLERLAGGCETLDVCGAPKAACLGETRRTLAELQAAAPYPLAPCEAPPNEPTCVPARPGEYDGVPTAADRDGDGIANELDDCPRVFDPIRPLDAGRQADADGDGLGDECDPCPFDESAECSASSADDLDGDGIPNAWDGCPLESDRDQHDRDADGIGDTCDFCRTSNPGVLPCPLSVPALREPTRPEHPPRHSLVAASNLRVVAVRPDSGSARGYYASQGSGPFSGIFVFTGTSSPGVELGSRIGLRGRLDAYQGTDELVAVTLLEHADDGSAVEPFVVDVASVGDGGELSPAYASMLVRIEHAAVTNENPDAPSDYDEFELDGALRVDDLLFPELDNAFARGTRFRSVTGVLGTSFGHAKLWPRSESDLIVE